MNRFVKVKREVIDEMERVALDHGGIKMLYASDVVESARPEDSPLHGEFEWNDKKAGHEYRLHQARKLIRAVVVVENRDGKEVKEPIWVHIASTPEETAERNPKSREGFYVHTADAVQIPDLFARALSALIARVKEAQRAVQELRDAAAGTADEDRMARIAVAILALQNAGAAVAALH